MDDEVKQPEQQGDSPVNWENIAKRALADLDNYKKQQEKLRGEMTQFMSLALLTRVLEIYEDLKRMLVAIQNTKLDPATIPAEVVSCQKGAMDGVVNILKKFTDVFKAEGLEPIEVKPGDKFDPATMETPYIWKGRAGEDARKVKVFDLDARRTIDREAAEKGIAFMERNVRDGRPFFF